MKNNVIYISGNTYEHREELGSVAFFDKALNCYVAPISKREAVADLAKRHGLQTNESYQEKFIEPRNKIEWNLRKTESQLNSANFRLNKLVSEISGNAEIQTKEITDKQISISELKETISALEENKRRLEEDNKRMTVQGFSFQSLADIEGESGEDWFESQPPKQPILLERQGGKAFLPKGIVALLCASGGTGKTRFLTQLGFSISAGIPFLNEFKNTREGTGRVFLGLGEEPIDGMRRRIHCVGQHYKNDREIGEIDFERLKRNLIPYSFYGQNVSLIDEGGLPTTAYVQLLDSLKQSEGDGYDLIILDPLSRFLGSKSETDNDNATKFITLMERITQEVKGKPTVLLAHHSKKGADWRSPEAFRGASSISASARWQLNMILASEDEKDENKKKKIKDFVKYDIVKRNDVPPLKEDGILKFSKDGVLIPSNKKEMENSSNPSNLPISPVGYGKFG